MDRSDACRQLTAEEILRARMLEQYAEQVCNLGEHERY